MVQRVPRPSRGGDDTRSLLAQRRPHRRRTRRAVRHLLRAAGDLRGVARATVAAEVAVLLVGLGRARKLRRKLAKLEAAS